MILLSHPTGNENVRHTALALLEAGLMDEFHTALSWNPDSVLNALMPHAVRRQLVRRSHAAALRPCVRTHPWREAARLASLAIGLRVPTQHETGWCSVDAVYRGLDRLVARRLASRARCTAVYAYEDGAATSFRAARERGMGCLYDLPIGHWRSARTILGDEAEREPQWASTLGGNFDSAAKLERKDEELSLASAVFVASEFTRTTLAALPGQRAPVHVVPYGAPEVRAERTRMRSKEDPLRVMFAGSLTQRKGLSYLLAACGSLRGAVELTLVGRRVTHDCVPLERALLQHRHIDSLPHAAMLDEMSRHDVLVLPSLFEGFGLVILEAMAQGVPVITTAHTAGPEVITDGCEGFIVPIRSADAIAERLTFLRERPRSAHDMAIAAQRKACALGWQTYRHRLVAAVRQELEGHPGVTKAQ